MDHSKSVTLVTKFNKTTNADKSNDLSKHTLNLYGIFFQVSFWCVEYRDPVTDVSFHVCSDAII